MWGQLRIIHGGHLKIRGDWGKFKYEGHTKFLGSFKNRGGKAFRGPVTEGCGGLWRYPNPATKNDLLIKPNI